MGSSDQAYRSSTGLDGRAIEIPTDATVAVVVLGWTHVELGVWANGKLGFLRYIGIQAPGLVADETSTPVTAGVSATGGVDSTQGMDSGLGVEDAIPSPYGMNGSRVVVKRFVNREEQEYAMAVSEDIDRTLSFLRYNQADRSRHVSGLYVLDRIGLAEVFRREIELRTDAHVMTPTFRFATMQPLTSSYSLHLAESATAVGLALAGVGL